MGGQKGSADYTLQGEDELEEICVGARAGQGTSMMLHAWHQQTNRAPKGPKGIDEVGSHRCEVKACLGGEERAKMRGWKRGPRGPSGLPQSKLKLIRGSKERDWRADWRKQAQLLGGGLRWLGCRSGTG